MKCKIAGAECSECPSVCGSKENLIEDEACPCIRTEEQDKIIFSLEEQIKRLLNIDLEREKIYMKAIETYGEEAQITMVFEEGSELQKALCKYLRKEHTMNKIELLPSIAEEIADVEIMLEQMKLLFGINNEVENFKVFKVDRLKERLKEEDSYGR